MVHVRQQRREVIDGYVGQKNCVLRLLPTFVRAINRGAEKSTLRRQNGWVSWQASEGRRSHFNNDVRQWVQRLSVAWRIRCQPIREHPHFCLSYHAFKSYEFSQNFQFSRPSTARNEWQLKFMNGMMDFDGEEKYEHAPKYSSLETDPLSRNSHQKRFSWRDSLLDPAEGEVSPLNLILKKTGFKWRDRQIVDGTELPTNPQANRSHLINLINCK